MVAYRRAHAPGGTFFFTLTLRDRRSKALTEHIDSLRDALRHELSRRPFHVDALVVLPDHLHALWTLPEGDTDYSGRWRSIKSRFVRELSRKGVIIPRNDKGEAECWQRRFWEHQIKDDEDLSRHIDYVHINPVKHGLVAKVADWPWSSFHRCVRQGILAPDWACAPDDTQSFGEP